MKITIMGHSQQSAVLANVLGYECDVMVATKITTEQYQKIEPCFPRFRKTPTMNNIEVLNALLYVLERGCKWRALPPEFGNWHTVYTRLSRWAKSGVLQEVFMCLQDMGVIHSKMRIMSLDWPA